MRELCGAASIDYIYGTEGIAGFVVDKDTNNEATYVYRKNIFGDVTAVYNDDGILQCTYEYDAWGNHVIYDADGKVVDGNSDNIGLINPIRYRGYYFDEETGLYYLKTRYYDPQVGRFMTIDGIEYLDPETINGLNLYAYCNNNPVMNVDPYGNKWWKWLISGIQLVAGIALCFVPGAQGIGVSLIVGGGLGLVSNAVSPAIGQAIGGASSIANGWGAFSTGLSILGLGIPGLIGGAALMLVGGATMAFGANEIVAAATGTNYIQQWTGMSDTAYGWTYFGLNLASSVGQIAGRAYSLYNTRTPIYNSKTGELKQYRYFDSKGRKLFDMDLRHPAYGNPKIKFPHFHAWLKNGTRLGINYTGYFIMILELFRRIFS